MKKISLLLVILCLALCLVFAVACNDPADSDTDTDTSSETDVNSESDVTAESDSDTAVEEYRIYIKDAEGNLLQNIKVQFCEEGAACMVANTLDKGYVVVPDGNHYLAAVKDLTGVYKEVEGLKIKFKDGEKAIEYVLTEKAN